MADSGTELEDAIDDDDEVLGFLRF